MPDTSFQATVARFPYFTEKGALSHGTTGAALLDYFAKSGTFRGRSQEEVDADCAAMWAESPQVALMILFYNRLVTRRAQGLGVATEQVQKGQGNRDEFRKALAWIARTQPGTYAENLWLVPIVGRWSDLWHETTVTALPRELTYALVADGMKDPYHRALVAKHLPRIRSKANTFNPRHVELNAWAHGLRKFLGWSERDYRKFKSDPEHGAHRWQRLMSAGRWTDLQFREIPGRALFRLMSRTGKDGKNALERHDQTDRYLAWLETQPVAKFTGYPYELYRAAKAVRSLAQRATYDKQFMGLIALAKSDRGGITETVWCCLDTSGSMSSEAAPGVAAVDVCVGLGLYFSALNEGAFKDHVVLFDSTSRLLKLSGTFTDRVQQIKRAGVAWGTTNFQSVIDLLVATRQSRMDLPASEFPTTLLIVSDMQFDAASADNRRTNYEVAMRKLAAVGLPEVRIVWWWVTGRGKDFPATLEDRGVILIGGFDGSVLELLLGGGSPATATGPASADPAGGEAPQQPLPLAVGPDEAMLRALDQDVLRRLTAVLPALRSP